MDKYIYIWLERWDPQLSNDVYEGGGLPLVEMAENEDFLQKKGLKNSFLEYRDSGSIDFGAGWDPQF